MSTKKLLGILSATTVALGATVVGVQAKPPDDAQGLERALQASPAGPAAYGLFDQLVGRFKEPGDRGRPDIFGPPGIPDIHPPGHYFG